MHRLLASVALALSACSPTLIVLPDGGPREDAELLDTPRLEDAGRDASITSITAEALPAGTLSTPRLGHTVTLLPNGHVVTIGGETLGRAALDSVEDFDPATNTWTEVATLPAPRSNHTATLLADGRVLVVGGGRASDNGLPAGLDVVGTALLYDPVAHTFEATGSLHSARGHHAAVRLADDSVLVLGGAGADEDGFAVLAEAERYVPSSGAFEPAGALLHPRAMLEVQLDADGHPLVLGGLGTSAGLATVDAVERWEDGTFSAAGALLNGGIFQATLRTSAGDVLVVGGLGAGFLDTTEVLRAHEATFAPGPDLPTARNSVALVETARGVLAIGGFLYGGSATLFDEILLFDLEAGTFTNIGALPLSRAAHRAVVLEDGDALIVGGYGALGETDAALRVRVSP